MPAAVSRADAAFDEFSQRIEYLNCCVTAHPSNIFEATVAWFQNVFSKVRLSYGMATNIITMQAEVPFNDEQRQRMKEVLDNCVHEHEGTGQARAKQPRHEWIEEYLTKADWDILKCQNHDMTSKIRVIASRCKSVRLKNVSENTAKWLAA